MKKILSLSINNLSLVWIRSVLFYSLEKKEELYMKNINKNIFAIAYYDRYNNKKTNKGY
ncbi:hypothetical protein [Spiroplasma floricola]|uniref:Uncharacterized protein n=1 Tax=Spiroplasma floricola 23-6 TaxID=1336749 RepID=A0A2K8SE56_9MOLU|nr:hypothetical protein [Spiroplasma floricola]AUB31741.1 hypothetical protein SFLOR_v1c06930 [Spiroplasma floricola 23-6]